MRKRSLAVIFLTVFLDLVGFGIVFPLLPKYVANFGAPAWLIGLIVASYSLMQFLFAFCGLIGAFVQGGPLAGW